MKNRLGHCCKRVILLHLSVAGEEDVIDETIKFFRANVFFRNFEVKGGADRTLVYLTLFIGECLKDCERVETKAEAERVLQATATKAFSVPGDAGFALGGMYPPPKSAAESDGFKSYFKQCREEVSRPLVVSLSLRTPSN